MQDPILKNISPEEKPALVRGVFNSVASRYDIMNDVMSGGMHRLWKNEMVSWLAPKAGQHIVDVAGGTGDIAFRIMSALSHRERGGISRGEGLFVRSSQVSPHPNPLPKGEGIRVTVLDINQSMLEEGRDRAIDRNKLSGVDWACADAEALPLPDACCDAYTIAFGIRNVAHIDRALTEAYRVLKTGGRFLCLEFSHVAPGLQSLYDAYSFHVIPRVGELITGDRHAYQYLVESIRLFPKQDDFAAMIKTAGFGNVQYRNLTQGVVAIHFGEEVVNVVFM